MNMELEFNAEWDRVLRDYSSMIHTDEVSRGDFVCTGLQQGTRDMRNYFGHVVQIRRKAGDFGSDLWLLRMWDGRLTSHANQSFYRIPLSQFKLAPYFVGNMPSDEDYSHGYTIMGENLEMDFIV
jgi:hypothetical protein